MADNTPQAGSGLQFVEGEPDGYCDPVTGVCMLPGAANNGSQPPSLTQPPAQ